jgi:hypothetical protein
MVFQRMWSCAPVGEESERAYRRGDAFEKRRELMQVWASDCVPIEVKVVDIGSRRKGGRR